MKSEEGKWGDYFEFDDEDEFETSLDLDLDDPTGEGAVFLEEAHEAINKLYQKTHKRDAAPKMHRKAESWH